jgi:uncharacterized membrane protein (UPF0127 family)
MKVYHRATGQLLAEQVALANTFFTRLRGLIARSRLAPTEALWLRPCNGVHTWWMHYAIDVIFLDRELRIVKLVENMRPFRLTAPHREARSVLLKCLRTQSPTPISRSATNSKLFETSDLEQSL